MDQNDTPNHPDRSDAGVGSTEYRAKLLTKLNCLMAVLEVAITKIDRSLTQPSANQERLTKVRSNLDNTLSICKRAKNTLERSIGPKGTTTTSKPRSAKPTGRPDSMSYRDYVELSSIDEYKKFKSLPPIDAKEIDSLDVDELLGKFYES